MDLIDFLYVTEPRSMKVVINVKKSSGMKRPIEEEANSLWAPLLLLIDKNNGTKRLVVDFRKLKKITRKNI